ncbi:23S rRNA (uracil(1939)-C(5))-methyltransferase RlmD [bacterium (Candidatus Blackallbacteria) CG17_big_fil_post_rev_8_21_14_2_50_48_46]|uniref:23S rRNA (Uracil(1939)-C(5))-methyltransferase RlmD n=1 Tax=bacterium (Candidatus Blackallbacteria) CG17_big_fil_post_rev_8_21_14_2_50_48_46 TaxID=2014261 RepID=A0A2M7G6X1_9BACT|nr:MAG: 23S rRNA (uracil(1939)-C(5))-methyltransferase RlmD [bacterium (Candidatus Blackallbacteria) CG18_big_fil_WC_8_21_14_2_50_49_26]PIW17436.1 MAG: 23S rRNA (uracil(1939)-C(5))-methyltransferase RlmD [bacterium (Candidatus Blackallbacteria) CG17_big_fil_post_rev_8_21_14_2_50_48_46]PIW48290.1 MAG: 23S rRNA (uracil(1939)-C(5))-methyltransferase RlmD [bacterium (Candidatus Blackallbacteria) CG13_big_fil_rev_8_21_14_2_50_49_14]
MSRLRPLQPGDLLEIEIEKMVPGGEGLGKVIGYPIFVPGGLPGDRGPVEIISVKKDYARGLQKALWQESPQRVEAPCPIAKECGGCQWQELDYSAQLEYKAALLSETLMRLGKFAETDLSTWIKPVMGMALPWHYRNKAQFPLQNLAGKVRGGFYAPRSHELVPVDSCLLHPEGINQTLNFTEELLNQLKIQAYEPSTGQGFIRHLVIRQSKKTGEILLGLVCGQWETPGLNTLVESLTQKLPHLVGIVQNLNQDPGNRILGKEQRILWGNETLNEVLGDFKFQISLPSFFQVNPEQTEVLYNTVKKMADLKGSETLLDAFAGAGTIGLWLSQNCKQVICIESLPEAIADGKRNAALNEVSNLEFISGKVENLIAQILKKQPLDLVILDPPRKGCAPEVLHALMETEISRLIYVSCNPATLARDLEMLSSNYQITEIQPVDMFPHTHHLETVVHLIRKQDVQPEAAEQN